MMPMFTEHLEERFFLSASTLPANSGQLAVDSLQLAASHRQPTAKSKVKRIVYQRPIIITKGGVYSGNWASSKATVPAVQIRTNKPVTIVNSNIKSAGSCIYALGYKVNLTVRNTRGYALNPKVVGKYPGRFLDIDGFSNLVAEHNYMKGTSGIYLYSYQGNHTAKQSVRVRYNSAVDIDGRFSSGGNSFLTGPNDNYYVQFFQMNGLQGLVGAEIAWNQIINQPYLSRVEENINIHNSTGTALSPIRIHDNYICGAYSASPLTDTTYTGGGIMMSDNGSSYVQAYNNQIISTSGVGIVISSGHDNWAYGNRIISSGLLPNGQPIAATNTGMYVWNYNNEPTFTNNGGYNNVIGWMGKGERNDWWVPDATAWYNNQSLPDPITVATEQAEWGIWVNKLSQASVKVGPTK